MEPGALAAAAVDMSRSAAATPGRSRRGLALGLTVASGFAALGCQIVWTQQGALWLGHEAAAVLAVVTAFFGGLALGALALGRRIGRSATPARWYAACEAAIGLWSLALAFLLPQFAGWLVDLTGAQPSPARQWSLAFGGTFALLLPATVAMGATLPAMERVMAQLRRGGSAVGLLYAGNTFGAVLGAIAAAFWLVPRFGLLRTAAACAALNLLCAAAALRLGVEAAGSTRPSSSPPSSPPSDTATTTLLFAATGLLGIGYEVLVVRVLSQVTENTVYTFAMLLAVYLVGTALGAAAWQRRPAGTASTDRLLRALAAACLFGMAALYGGEAFRAMLANALGGGMAAALAAEAAVATAAFLPATFVMGALFSQLGSAAAVAGGIGFGRALGVNTLGAAFAPPLFGAWLLPAVGARSALLLVVAGYLALSLLSSSRRARRRPALWGLAAAVPALALFAPPLGFVDVPAGGRIVSLREGAMAAVSVVEDADGVARLRIDNRQQEGSSATLTADARQALLPLLLHPAPRRALFLGLGTGVTAASAAEDPMLQVDAVELLPEVIEASTHFIGRGFAEGATASRLHMIAADARRYVRAAGPAYDLVVADNFHPARSGSGSLYTVEHFEAVRRRLASGGLFCQWLPLHQLDLETLRSIVQTFVAVYPGASALLATHSLDTPVLGLLARADGGRIDLAQVRRRLATAALPRRPAEFGLADDLALFGGFVAGPRALRRFAGDAALNTDDRPVVAHLAPRITYAADSLPRDRLVELLRRLDMAPGEVVDASSDPAWTARLSAYRQARDRYLEAGRDVEPSADVRRMLAQVREPLLSVLRISPDFRPAYDPLLRMAAALGRIDAAAGRELLQQIEQAQPARPEAAQALRRLAGVAP